MFRYFTGASSFTTFTLMRTDPKGIVAHDGICTTCLNAVEVEVKTITEVDECGSCRYLDRPFALGSAHASGPCCCEWRHVSVEMSTCSSCKSCYMCGDIIQLWMGDYKNGRRICPSCKECCKCGAAVGDSRHISYGGPVCTACEATLARERKIKGKHEFGQKWKTMSVHDKLQVHGKVKLMKLAAKKDILKKGPKESLISRLLPLTTDTDFPIR